MVERCPKCGAMVWFTDDICPSCRSHCPTRDSAAHVGEGQPTAFSPNECPSEREGGCQRRGISFRPWIYCILCGGLAGLGLGGNFELAHWYPRAPGVVSSICAAIGIGLLAGLCLTPLFRSAHPKAVAAQGAVLGATLGAFVATLPVALGADWPNVGSLANFGPTAKPFFQFVIMAMFGTVGGSIVGLIGWSKLNRSRRNDTES